MNKQKGFTLIELLAVIVILAIIALIATPIVVDIIKDANENSIKLSAESYIETVEKAYMSKLTSNQKIENKLYSIKELDELGVEIKGEKPKGENDYVILQSGKAVEYELTIKGYTVTYKDGNMTILSGDAKLLDHTVTFMVDGKPYEIVSVKEGNKVSDPTTLPTKEGETFAWWLLDGVKQDMPYTPTSDVVFDAYFSPIRYDLEISDNSSRFLEAGGYSYSKYTNDVSIIGHMRIGNYVNPVLVSRTYNGARINRDGRLVGETPKEITAYGETWYYYMGYGAWTEVPSFAADYVFDLNSYVEDTDANFGEPTARVLIDIYLGKIPSTD